MRASSKRRHKNKFMGSIERKHMIRKFERLANRVSKNYWRGVFVSRMDGGFKKIIILSHETDGN